MKEKDYYPEITKKLTKINNVLTRQKKEYIKFEQEYNYIKTKRRGEENDDRTIEGEN